jgi:heme-degrading monooxygenase HmoA
MRPDIAQEAFDELEQQSMAEIPGHVGTYVYRMDSNPNEFYLVVMFESREAYWRNAESPEQHERFLKFMQYAAAEPEWHDGEIVLSYLP